MSRPKNKDSEDTDILKITISSRLVDKIEFISRRLGVKPNEYVRVTLARAIERDLYKLGLKVRSSE